MLVILGQFTELGTKIGKNIREYCDTKHNNQHGPQKFVVIGWKNVAVSYSRTSHSSPVDRCNILLKHSCVLKLSASDPVHVSIDITLTREVPETSGAMQNVRKNHKCLNKILNLDLEVMLLQHGHKKFKRIPSSAHLEEEHNFVESR